MGAEGREGGGELLRYKHKLVQFLLLPYERDVYERRQGLDWLIGVKQ